MTAVRAHAFARAGLVGNPSDLYGGAGIGFTFDAFRAEVELADAAEWSCPSPLLEAALAEAADLEQPPGAFRFTSDVPRQAGLAGSSAIVIAALRALAARAGGALPPSELAERAWRAENERLGIRSGPMDRLVQAHGGLLRMDFAMPFAPGACAALDPAALPPLLLAWDPHPGRASGAVHDEVWAAPRCACPATTSPSKSTSATSRSPWKPVSASRSAKVAAPWVRASSPRSSPDPRRAQPGSGNPAG